MASKRAVKPHPVRVKAVIFDLDGTLVHSAVDFPKLKRETIDFLVRKGLPAERFSTDMKTYDIMRLASMLFREKSFAEQDFPLVTKIEEMWNRIELESVDKTAPIEGAKSTLQKLKRQGIRVAIVTRGCREYALEALRVAGLLDMVDVIVGRDDATHPKPNPEPLLKAIETLSLGTDDVVMVGDNIEDAQCAHGADVRFIGVTLGKSTTETFRDLRCEAILEDLQNLINLLD